MLQRYSNCVKVKLFVFVIFTFLCFLHLLNCWPTLRTMGGDFKPLLEPLKVKYLVAESLMLSFKNKALLRKVVTEIDGICDDVVFQCLSLEARAILPSTKLIKDYIVKEKSEFDVKVRDWFERAVFESVVMSCDSVRVASELKLKTMIDCYSSAQASRTGTNSSPLRVLNCKAKESRVKSRVATCARELQIEQAQMAELRENALRRAESRRKEAIRWAEKAREEAERAYRKLERLKMLIEKNGAKHKIEWEARLGAVKADDWSDMKSDQGSMVNGCAGTASGVQGHRPTTSEGISVGVGSDFGLCKGDAGVECHVTNSNVPRLALANNESSETRAPWPGIGDCA